MQKFSAVLVLALVFVGVASALRANAAVPSNLTLSRVVFAHRHGARTPVSNVNGSCDKLGCGALTMEGQKMLESLGNNFLQEYGLSLFGVNDATQKAAYDYHKMKVVSDGSDRCIQSAGSFWNGLWGANSGVNVNGAPHVPVIKTTAQEFMDPWGSWPAFQAHEITMYPAAILNLTKYVTDNIISVKDIAAIGKEMQLFSLECDVVPFACLAQEVDFLASMRTSGRISEFPLGEKFFPQLVEARDLFYPYIEGKYDLAKGDTFFQDAGWPGAYLARAMIGDANDDGIQLSQYSGHDTSLMPLYAALGNMSFSYPVFATAFVLEVYSAPIAGSKKVAKFVKAKVGSPEQLPTSNHEYTFTPYELYCTDDKGTTYSTTALCPIEDLERYIVSRSPGDPCYLWPKDQKDILCMPEDNSILSTGAGTPCGKYRAVCPFQACGDNYRMLANRTCVPL